MALLAENGPCWANEYGNGTIPNEFSWTNKANVIWVKPFKFEFYACSVVIVISRWINQLELDSQVVFGIIMRMVLLKISMISFKNSMSSCPSTKTTVCTSQVIK